MSQPMVYQIERIYLRGGPAEGTFQRVSLHTVAHMAASDAGQARYVDSGERTPGGERIFDYDSGIILP